MTRDEERSGEVALSVADLVVSYSGTTAVNHVSLQVLRGEIFGLLGPNGAGKTSTLSAIEGLVRPVAGSIRVAGIDVRQDPLTAKARLGIQLQATSFQSELTVREIVRLYAGIYGLRITRADIAHRMRAIGIESELGKRFRTLSGGQQQRLSLFMATIHNPAVLLLDEPTAGLDPQARRQLWDRIERLRGEGGSILLTTHSMEEAQAVCDRVAIIDRGELVAVDAPAKLIANHRDDPRVLKVARGKVTLEDVFIGLTGSDVRE